jgi:hypothetical protein
MKIYVYACDDLPFDVRVVSDHKIIHQEKCGLSGLVDTIGGLEKEYDIDFATIFGPYDYVDTLVKLLPADINLTIKE